MHPPVPGTRGAVPGYTLWRIIIRVLVRTTLRGTSTIFSSGSVQLYAYNCTDTGSSGLLHTIASQLQVPGTLLQLYYYYYYHYYPIVTKILLTLVFKNITVIISIIIKISNDARSLLVLAGIGYPSTGTRLLG